MLDVKPIFVFGCAWRCGSTLVQRLINSSHDILIWGENAGLFASFSEIFIELQRLENLSDRQSKFFLKNSGSAWTANMNPTVVDNYPSALRAFCTEFYERNLPDGLSRWGVKEVRCDASTAKLIWRAYPSAKVIFIYRPLVEVLSSNCVNHWYEDIGGLEGVVSTWKQNCASFLELEDPRLLRINYSDLRVDGSIIASIECFLELSPGSIDQEVLSKKVRGSNVNPKIGRAEKKAALHRDIVEIERSFQSRTL